MIRVRPGRPWVPIPLSIMALFVWWVVAHNSGSGWVQFLGDAALGVILVGIFGPAVIVARNKVQVVASPTDATAGLPAAVRLLVSTRVQVRPIVPAGPDSFCGPITRPKRFDDELILVPTKRGVHSDLILQIASAAPFGLQWWSRKVTVPLPSPLQVAPRLGEQLPLPYLDRDHDAGGRQLIRTEIGDPHGIRPYQAGDHRRRVHWPSTAHMGRLMVRENEDQSGHPVTLRVSLPYDEDSAERTAEQALGTAIKALDLGAPLVMATDETDGPVVASVTDPLQAGRRLARAVASTGSAQIDITA